LQLVINIDGDENLRSDLHAILAREQVESILEKKQFYRDITERMMLADAFVEHACFEYETDAEEAHRVYREWVNEIEAELSVKADESGAEVDGVERLDAEQRYIVLSQIFLMDKPHAFAAELDDENDDDYSRKNISRLIESVKFFDFSEVIADAVFLVPGNDADGFSWSDLANEGWEHLHMVRA